MCKLRRDLYPIFEKIGCDKNIAAYRDPFDLWATFLMLAAFIYNRLDTSLKVLEKVPVESYPEEVKVLVKNLSATDSSSSGTRFLLLLVTT